MREFLKIDGRKAAKLKDGSEELCRILNNCVIPVIKAVGAVPDVENVWGVYEDPGKLAGVCLGAVQGNFSEMGEALQELTTQYAARRASEVLEGITWNVLPGKYRAYVNVQEGGATVDHKAIEEAASIYIEGAAVEARKLHKSIAEQLTKLFANITPISLNAYFEYENGHYQARESSMDYNVIAGIWDN